MSVTHGFYSSDKMFKFLMNFSDLPAFDYLFVIVRMSRINQMSNSFSRKLVKNFLMPSLDTCFFGNITP